jgi:hypothetical protein
VVERNQVEGVINNVADGWVMNAYAKPTRFFSADFETEILRPVISKRLNPQRIWPKNLAEIVILSRAKKQYMY